MIPVFCRFFLINYNPLGLPSILKSINPNQSFNHYQVASKIRIVLSSIILYLLYLTMIYIFCNPQKLMVTSHNKLNLDTEPCLEDEEYNFQALSLKITIMRRRNTIRIMLHCFLKTISYTNSITKQTTQLNFPSGMCEGKSHQKVNNMVVE